MKTRNGMKHWLVTLLDFGGRSKRLCWHCVMARTEKSAENKIRKELRWTFTDGFNFTFDNRFKVMGVKLVDDAEYTRLCNAVFTASGKLEEAKARLANAQMELKSAESYYYTCRAKRDAVDDLDIM